MANIKQILVGSTTYDIEALHFTTGSLDTPAQWKQYIDDLANKGIQIVIADPATGKQEPATTASASTMGKLYMVQFSGQTESGTYTEFITIESGTSTKTYSWEKIGTTAADLSEYAKKGTYNTSSAGEGTTGEGGAETAVGTASVTYSKASNATGSAGGATVNGSNFTFTGTKATLTLTQDYQPAGTVSKPGITLGTKATITYATGSAKSGGTAAAVTAYPNFSGGSASGTFVTSAIASASLDVKTTSATGYQAVVTAQGTLSGGSATGTFNTNAIKDITLSASDTSTDGPAYISAVSGTFNNDAYKASVDGTTLKLVAAGTASVNPTVKYMKHTNTAAATASVSYTAPSLGAATTKYIKVNTTAADTDSVSWTAASLGTPTTATVIKSDGLTTATFNNYTSASLDNAPVFTGTTATLSLSTDYTPSGSIGGSQTINGHTHSITLTDATASGSASVPISAHTHSIGNHTHSVVIQ